MPEHLEGKVVLVTGAAGGFGALIAEKCAARGAAVVATDVDGDTLATTVDGIREQGFDASAVTADVTDREAMCNAARYAADRHGALDVLVNNAGVMPLAYFSDHEKAADRWEAAIDINLKGVLNGITAVYDMMIAQQRGHVVNISSIFGNAGIEGSGVYSATKAAVTVLPDALRRETKGRIKVSTIKPTGVTGTNLASGIVNEEAIIGLTAARAATYVENAGMLEQGTLSAEQTDRDSPRYWLITPDDLAEAVVAVIDQPWGITLSDVTVRATGEDYMY